MGQESGKRPKFELEPKVPAKTPEAVQDEHHAFNAVVGEGIRRSRQGHGWTQAFLADQAGLSPNYVARLERGELGPSLFVANRICEALTSPSRSSSERQEAGRSAKDGHEAAHHRVRPGTASSGACSLSFYFSIVLGRCRAVAGDDAVRDAPARGLALKLPPTPQNAPVGSTHAPWRSLKGFEPKSSTQ